MSEQIKMLCEATFSSDAALNAISAAETLAYVVQNFAASDVLKKFNESTLLQYVAETAKPSNIFEAIDQEDGEAILGYVQSSYELEDVLGNWDTRKITRYMKDTLDEEELVGAITDSSLIEEVVKRCSISEIVDALDEDEFKDYLRDEGVIETLPTMIENADTDDLARAIIGNVNADEIETLVARLTELLPPTPRPFLQSMEDAYVMFDNDFNDIQRRSLVNHIMATFLSATDERKLVLCNWLGVDAINAGSFLRCEHVSLRVFVAEMLGGEVRESVEESARKAISDLDPEVAIGVLLQHPAMTTQTVIRNFVRTCGPGFVLGVCTQEVVDALTAAKS